MTPARSAAYAYLNALYDHQEQAIIEAKREIRGRYAPKIAEAKARLAATNPPKETK